MQIKCEELILSINIRNSKSSTGLLSANNTYTASYISSVRTFQLASKYESHDLHALTEHYSSLLAVQNCGLITFKRSDTAYQTTRLSRNAYVDSKPHTTLKHASCTRPTLMLPSPKNTQNDFAHIFSLLPDFEILSRGLLHRPNQVLKSLLHDDAYHSHRPRIKGKREDTRSNQLWSFSTKSSAILLWTAAHIVTQAYHL